MSDSIDVKIEGLTENIQKMSAFPRELEASTRITMNASLTVIHENVPPYPTRPSDYVRTGTLGRSLGSSMTGGKGGYPDIYETKIMGSESTGRFGTRLEYAGYVIGPDNGAIGERQAWMHKGIWWQMKTIKEASQTKIVGLWKIMSDKLAVFLKGKQ